ncbi:MAG: hypothetical protein ACYDH9_14590 [Limisphaerales bacterium]
MTPDPNDGTNADWLECAICGQVNNASEDLCDKCGHHLYLFCGICGQQNKRIKDRCEKCGTRLEPAPKAKTALQTVTAGKRITRVQLMLVVLAGLAAYLLLAWLLGL